RVFSPVHAELELEGDPRDHPDCEVHQEEPAPVLRHLQEGLVPCPRIARFHVRGHHGEAEGERDEEEVEHCNGGKLDPGERRDVHRPNISWPAGAFNNPGDPCRFLLAMTGITPTYTADSFLWLRHQASSVRGRLAWAVTLGELA